MSLWQTKRSRQLVTSASPGPVVGVLSASGGLGASTLAVAMAVRASSDGLAALLIDVHPYAGGLDICLGLDTNPGLRWPDLASVRGDPDARAVLDRLPAVGSCRVLSWDRSPTHDVVAQGVSIAAALTDAVQVSIIDLPGPDALDAAQWWKLCDDIVLVCGTGVRHIAAAAVVLERIERWSRPPTPAVVASSPPTTRKRGLAPRVHGVLRQSGVRLDRDRASALLGLPLLAVMPRDGAVESALISGEPIGRRSSPVAKLADALLGDIIGRSAAA